MAAARVVVLLVVVALALLAAVVVGGARKTAALVDDLHDSLDATRPLDGVDMVLLGDADDDDDNNNNNDTPALPSWVFKTTSKRTVRSLKCTSKRCTCPRRYTKVDLHASVARPHANGCGVDGMTEALGPAAIDRYAGVRGLGLAFRAACNAHDMCYASDETRTACDNNWCEALVESMYVFNAFSRRPHARGVTSPLAQPGHTVVATRDAGERSARQWIAAYRARTLPAQVAYDRAQQQQQQQQQQQRSGDDDGFYFAQQPLTSAVFEQSLWGAQDAALDKQGMDDDASMNGDLYDEPGAPMSPSAYAPNMFFFEQRAAAKRAEQSSSGDARASLPPAVARLVKSAINVANHWCSRQELPALCVAAAMCRTVKRVSSSVFANAQRQRFRCVRDPAGTLAAIQRAINKRRARRWSTDARLALCATCPLCCKMYLRQKDAGTLSPVAKLGVYGLD